MDKLLIIVVVMMGVLTSVIVSESAEPVCSRFAYEEKLLEKMVRGEWKMERLVENLENFKSEWQNKNTDVDSKMDSMSTLLNDTNDNMKMVVADLEKAKTEMAELTTRLPEVDSSISVVAFSARNLKDLTLPNGGALVFDVVDYNDGNGYDAKTGIFTAPHSGWYSFMTHICNKGGHEAAYAINKDGVDIIKSVQSDKAYYSCNSLSIVTQVQAGGKVKVRNTYSSSHFYQDSSYRSLIFSGIRLFHA